MSDKVQVSSGGVGFLGLLTILFIGLKLTGHISWSWWLVLAPLWVLPATFFGLAGVCLAVAALLFVIGAFASVVDAIYKASGK